MARKAKKVVFGESIVVSGKEIKEVTMRPPKGKDLRAVSHIINPVERDFAMISNLCGLNATVEEMEEFDGAEIVQLQGALKSFLLSTPKI